MCNIAGAVDDDLDRAINRSLRVRRVDAALLGHAFSWQASARQFESALFEALECGSRALLAAE